MTEDIAERVRNIGGTTIRSIGHIARLQRIPDNDADYVAPKDMLSELRENEKSLILSMQAVHTLCDDAADVPLPVFLRPGLTRLSAGVGSSLKQLANKLLGLLIRLSLNRLWG
jgi:hypothetical protein